MKEFRFAIKNTVPIFFTYLFIGIAFGILMSEAGYGVLLSTASAFFIFAGSMQIVGVDLYVDELRADRIELPKTHDAGGGVSEYSYGNARDYVSVSDDELVNEYHTPIEHATNGALSNSTCLIAESAITEYDGSRTVENVTTYPITHLGDSSVVHGKLAVEDDTVIDGTVAI